MTRSKFGLGISSMLALVAAMSSAQAQTPQPPATKTTIVVVQVTEAQEREAARRLLNQGPKKPVAIVQQNQTGTSSPGAPAPKAMPAPVQPPVADPIAEATAEQIRKQTARDDEMYRRSMEQEALDRAANREVMLSNARIAENQAFTNDQINSGYALSDLQYQDLVRQNYVREAHNTDMVLTYGAMSDSANAFQDALARKQGLAFGNIAMSQQILTNQIIQSDLDRSREQGRLDMTQQAVGYPLGEFSRPIGGLIWAVGWGDDRKLDDAQRDAFYKNQAALYGYQAHNMDAELKAGDQVVDLLGQRMQFLEARYKAMAAERQPVQQRQPANNGGGAPSQQP